MKIVFSILFCFMTITCNLFARDIEYNNIEIDVYVSPGEPTQIEFPSEVKGGYKKSTSNINIERKGRNLIVFGKETLPESGEAIIVSLENTKSYSIRIKPSDEDTPRDSIVSITDGNDFSFSSDEEYEPRFKQKVYGQAPINSVSGLMREMVLAMEFGKNKIPGFRVSTKHSGEVILNDGTMLATIDKIYIGTDLWGYVLNAQNLLESNQQINPATFRVDGTRAVMAQRWELAPRAINAEQQISARDRSKVYIVTRAK